MQCLFSPAPLELVVERRRPSMWLELQLSSPMSQSLRKEEFYYFTLLKVIIGYTYTILAHIFVCVCVIVMITYADLLSKSEWYVYMYVCVCTYVCGMDGWWFVYM